MEKQETHSGWSYYSFNTLKFRETALHEGEGVASIAGAFSQGPGKPHLNYLVMPPGSTVGMHLHRYDGEEFEEWWVIIDGEGEMSFHNGDTVALKPGDTVVVHHGMAHQAIVKGDRPLRCVVILPKTPARGIVYAPGKPEDFQARSNIEIKEVNYVGVPLKAVCHCGAEWTRPEDDPHVRSLPVWASKHRGH